MNHCSSDSVLFFPWFPGEVVAQMFMDVLRWSHFFLLAAELYKHNMKPGLLEASLSVA